MTIDGYETARERYVRRAETEGLIDVAVEQHNTPLGSIMLAATTEGVVRVGLPNEPADDLLGELATDISPRILRASRPSTSRARRQLDEYFAGLRTTFDVPIDWRLTSGFRRDVLHATQLVRYGSTPSYSEVAAHAGKPRAVREAATGLATNPVPILVPCHRVIHSDGRTGNYRGGQHAKQFLLNLEQDR